MRARGGLVGGLGTVVACAVMSVIVSLWVFVGTLIIMGLNGLFDLR